MPDTGKAEKPDSEKKPPRAKAGKKTRAIRKKAGTARKPAAKKVKKARAGGKTNGETAPAMEQTQDPVPGRADIILESEQAVLVEIIRLPSQGPANDLLAQELGLKSTYPEHMRDRVGIPAFGEHRHRDDAANRST